MKFPDHIQNITITLSLNTYLRMFQLDLAVVADDHAENT